MWCHLFVWVVFNPAVTAVGRCADSAITVAATIATLGASLLRYAMEWHRYVTDKSGAEKLIYMDEVGTPDSSRIWVSMRSRRAWVHGGGAFVWCARPSADRNDVR